MSFISVLKKIGHGAEVVGKDALAVAGPAASVAATIDPALAPVAALVSGISHAVLTTAKAPTTASATGPQKKDAVLTMVESVTPVLIELLLAKMGRTVGDTARFNSGVGQVIEGVLDIYKSFGAIPTAAPPPATGATTK